MPKNLDFSAFSTCGGALIFQLPNLEVGVEACQITEATPFL